MGKHGASLALVGATKVLRSLRWWPVLCLNCLYLVDEPIIESPIVKGVGDWQFSLSIYFNYAACLECDPLGANAV